MSTGYFKNNPVNENVYFYRFLNIVRSLISRVEFEDLVSNAINHGEIFNTNVQDYIKYRNKIKEMMDEDN
jgi:lysine/ornithine N-monooxygenase